jgi:phosphopantothenoylcysteine decarboxylase/phosphopantothenate--cysteine ligase
MWAHAATRANVQVLLARGVELLGPDEGELAEGEWGVGRMAEPVEIAARVEALLGPVGPLAGRRVLVSAGGTREPIDSVRFVGNRSSGRMGVALAEEARRRGAIVTLLAANLAVPAPAGVEVISTPTVSDLAREALSRSNYDVVVMAAAPADYAPVAPLVTKRPKDAQTWMLELEPTTDIIREIGAGRRTGQVLVAFGADHGEAGLERKRALLADKHVDLVVYNDVGAEGVGFDSPDNAATLVTAAGERELDRAPKSRIAAAILDEVEGLLGAT